MHIPKRMCVACRQMKPKGELIKTVKTDTGAEVDITYKKAGRGAYICRCEECIALARKKKLLSRHFKAAVSVEIYDKLAEAVKNE